MGKEYKSKEYLSDSDSDSENELVTSVFDKEFKTYKINSLSKIPSSFNKNIINKKKGSKSKQKLVFFKIPKNININEVEIFQNKQKAIELITKDDTTFHLNEDSMVNTENLRLLINGENAEGKLIPLDDDVLKNIKCYTAIEKVVIPNIDFDASRIPRKNVVQLDSMSQEHFATGYDAKDYFNDNEISVKDIEIADDKKEKKAKKEKKEKKEKKDKKEKKSKK